MYINLAYKNILKSLKLYFVYLLTLVLCIALFYSFNSISESSAITSLITNEEDYINLFTISVRITTYFVTFFVVFLMIYSHNFFFKIRSKEFFVYKTLGMSKSRIRKIILLENLFIMFLTIIIGFFIGIVINFILNIILLEQFEIDSSYGISVSLKVIFETILYFSFLQIFISIFAARKINKKTAYELKNNKQTISTKTTKKSVNIVMFIIGISMLVYAYILEYRTELDFTNSNFYIAIIIGILSTLCIYISAINLFDLKNSKSNKLFSNVIIKNRLRSSRVVLGFISLVIFLILTTIAGANLLTSSLNNTLPKYDFSVNYYNYTEDYNFTYFESIPQSEQLLVTAKCYDNCTVVVFPREDYKMFSDFYGLSNETNSDTLIFTGRKSINSGSDNTNDIPIDDYLQTNFNTSEYINMGRDYYEYFTQTITIFTDYDFEGYNEEYDINIKYNFIITGDEEFKDELNTYASNYDDELTGVFDNEHDNEMMKNRSKFYIASTEVINEFSVLFKVLILFIMYYIALVLLLICIAILALQQVIDSIDQKPEYDKAKLIGITNKEINSIISKNTITYFLSPMPLALISSIISIIIINNYLIAIGGDDLLKEYYIQVIFTYLIVIIIYLLYIFVARYIYFKVIEDK